ncbi:uncharacterized protein N7482_004021 [Penicillium canariense]|uniref:Uncharacterized protein n=1 Tax=Penicillium canariense TaxID=189055 RepID=A0A9W9I9N9_9EURO|nr:uncharacterized protein N7482_004021 [Penicillium canariense]KAJ5168427.1 hypothetical protein N7482_004021 [Penicillium canariense]
MLEIGGNGKGRKRSEYSVGSMDAHRKFILLDRGERRGPTPKTFQQEPGDGTRLWWRGHLSATGSHVIVLGKNHPELYSRARHHDIAPNPDLLRSSTGWFRVTKPSRAGYDDIANCTGPAERSMGLLDVSVVSQVSPVKSGQLVHRVKETPPAEVRTSDAKEWAGRDKCTAGQGHFDLERLGGGEGKQKRPFTQDATGQPTAQENGLAAPVLRRGGGGNQTGPDPPFKMRRTFQLGL